jgi:hypothetical protein
MPQRREMTRELAETVAIQALGFLADDPDRIGRFLALTGLAPESLRAAAQEPNFLLGVLDHLASDQALLHEFATRMEIGPEVVTLARDLLAGAPPATA